MFDTAFQSVISTMNSFLTYYFYFSVSLMLKSKMAAIAIMKNIITSLFAEKICNTTFQSVISTIKSFIRV